MAQIYKALPANERSKLGFEKAWFKQITELVRDCDSNIKVLKEMPAKPKTISIAKKYEALQNGQQHFASSLAKTEKAFYEGVRMDELYSSAAIINETHQQNLALERELQQALKQAGSLDICGVCGTLFPKIEERYDRELKQKHFDSALHKAFKAARESLEFYSKVKK